MNLFKKVDKRRKSSEGVLSESFLLRLSPSEMAFVKKRSGIECNSVNGIIRQCINKSKSDIEMIPNQD